MDSSDINTSIKDPIWIDFYNMFLNDYLLQTIADMEDEDSLQAEAMRIGLVNYFYAGTVNRLNFARSYLLRKAFLELENMHGDYEKDSAEFNIENDPDFINKVSRHNPDLKPRKYICKAHMSNSNNLYFFREIEYQ